MYKKSLLVSQQLCHPIIKYVDKIPFDHYIHQRYEPHSTSRRSLCHFWKLKKVKDSMNLCVHLILPIFCVQRLSHCTMYSSKMVLSTSSWVQSMVQFSWWTELHAKQSKHWVLTTNIQQMNREKNCLWVMSIILTDFLFYYCFDHNMNVRFFN